MAGSFLFSSLRGQISAADGFIDIRLDAENSLSIKDLTKPPIAICAINV